MNININYETLNFIQLKCTCIYRRLYKCTFQPYKHIDLKENIHLISSSYCYLHNDWFPHKCTHMQTMDFIGKAINLKNNILHVFIHDY